MAADGGHADRGVAPSPGGAGLATKLEAEPYRFDFFQAVSLLERSRPHASPVGEGVHPEHEAVRFTADPGLEFPASDVSAVLPPTQDGDPYTMRVPFLALAGVQGPLPRVYTERMLGNKARNTPLRAFLDIFHHRLASIFYRARKKRRIPLEGRTPEESIAAPMLRSIAGLGTPGLANRMAVPDRAMLRYASVVALRPRSALGLQAMLTSYFGVRVRVDQFVGRWRALEPEDRTTIGAYRGTSNVLGSNAVLGTHVWDQSGAVKVVVGPLTARQYRDFLPTGSALQPFKDMVQLYCGPELDVEIDLVLHTREDARSKLERQGPPALGWTSWLPTPGRVRTPGARLFSGAR